MLIYLVILYMRLDEELYSPPHLFNKDIFDLEYVFSLHLAKQDPSYFYFNG